MFAATLPTFWPLYKLFFSFRGCTSLRFGMRLCCDKIFKGLRLGLNTSFFFLDCFEQNFIPLQLLVFSHPIVDNYQVSLKIGAKIVEHPNFERVFNCDILLFNTSFESIILRAILCHVFASVIGELVDRGGSSQLIYGISKSIPLLQPFTKIE